jgi:hypothetical protein
LHASLNIEDHISSLIRKERLLHYHDGTDIAGVLREFDFDQKRPYDQWIREVFFFDNDFKHYIILCCTDQQANAFQEAQFIQVDLSFKMIQGKANVFNIAGWNEEHQRKLSLPLAYAKHILSLQAL